MSKATELFELDDDELQNRVAASRRELLNLRFQLATGQLDNTQRLSDVKREIARALTVLRSRDLYEIDIELEPLVLTPVRRPALDTTGGIDEEALEEESEDGDEVDDATEAFTDDSGADDYDEDEEDAELDSEALDEHDARAELPDGSGEPGGDEDASDDDSTEEDG
jgi:large subunit ribosomal protein L29